jgi:hypothetical protein
MVDHTIGRQVVKNRINRVCLQAFADVPISVTVDRSAGSAAGTHPVQAHGVF